MSSKSVIKRLRYEALGLCNRCSSPREDPIKKQCARCRANSNIRSKASRLEELKNNSCECCGQNDEAFLGYYNETIMCHNCGISIRTFGECGHKMRKEIEVPEIVPKHPGGKWTGKPKKKNSKRNFVVP